MFIGHYAASFALKKLAPRTSLRSLLLGVQFVDILFMIFILFGIERMRLIPGTTASNALQLDFMPYTHSLVGSVLWAVAAFLLFRFALLPRSFGAARNVVAGAVSASVLSHYFFDVPMHIPDLPLFGDDSYKLGFGLWNNRTASIALEFFLTLGTFALYLTASKPGKGFAGKFGMPIFGCLLLVICVVQYFLPPPGTILVFSLQALASYLGIAFLGGWLDTKRDYRS